MKHIFYLIVVVLSSGCAATPKEIRASLSETCKEIGFVEKTEGFSNCMLQLITSHDNTRSRNSAAILNGMISNPPFRNY